MSELGFELVTFVLLNEHLTTTLPIRKAEKSESVYVCERKAGERGREKMQIE